MRNLFSIAALSLILASCSTKQEQAMLIIESKSQQDIDYSVNKRRPSIGYDPIEISKGKLSSNDSIILIVPLGEPRFIKTKFNNRYYTLYLEPDNSLHITITDSSALFVGDGANINNYLALSRVFWNKCNSDVGKYTAKPPKEYGQFIDSVSIALENFNSVYLENHSIKNEKWNILTVKNECELIVLKTIYKLVNPTAFRVLDSIPKSLLNIYGKLPIDKIYLQMGMQEYFNVLELYNRFEVIFPLTNNVNENDSIIAKTPIVAYYKIKETDSLKLANEFLLAKYVSYWLSEKGITPEIDSIYNDFRNEYSNSKYLASLETHYREFYALTLGQPAPEITGVSMSGDTITLSSLKGKIVYVDVWATWCGACIEEFPYYEAIQGEFKDNTEVIFLFVSIDSEKEKWENYLKNKAIVSGTQILELKNNKHPTISESYKLWGIPRYMLIDKEGEIINNRASRPSSGKVIDEIKDLL